MTFPLEGVKVLDLSVLQQGTYASALLADMGADVIKIESPATPDPGRAFGKASPNGMYAYFQHLNRNKRGICLDLKNEVGRETFLQLIEQADIFHSNMRPGVLERLRLTYADVSERNPRIIVSHATGWGHMGPDAEAGVGAVDPLAQARSGLMSINAIPEGDPHWVPGIGLADQVGAMVSAYGMMVALWERERSGTGQEVNTSLYGSQLAMQGRTITAAMWDGQDPELRKPEDSPPHWDTYRCSDGRFLKIAGTTPDRWWADFCEVLEVPECAEGTYSQNSANLEWSRRTRERLIERFATKTADEWMQLLSPRFLVQPIRTYMEVAKDPQAWANGYLVNVPSKNGGDPVPTVGVPVHLSRTPGSIRHLGPELGQHTEEVLLEFGFDWEKISDLREQGAFGSEW